MKVHFAVFVVALVAGFIGRGYCQLDCAFPEEDDFIVGIAGSISGGDSAALPTVTISRSKILCLAHSEERGRYRLYSVLVNYTCEGNAECPDDSAVEQFEGQCVSGSWSGSVLGTFIDTRSVPNEGTTFNTSRRDDCSFCISEGKTDVGVPSDSTLDPVTHCLECVGCNDDRTCNGFSAGDCCNVLINDMCMTACPVDQTPDANFDCVDITCPNDLGDVANGEVSYSNPEETDGGYRIGTVASVTCDTDYTGGGGDVTCEMDGSWSSSLPICEAIPYCDQPPKVDNANVSNPMDRWPIDSTAYYECLGGFYFTEDSEKSIVCTDPAVWPRPDNIKCLPCADLFPDCKLCDVTDGKPTCIDCNDNFRMRDDSCEEITGDGGDDEGNETCIPCIVVPLAVLLALLLAIVVAVAMYAYYRWHKAPATDLNKKDPEGINGVARDNPLYVDPEAVADEGEE